MNSNVNKNLVNALFSSIIHYNEPRYTAFLKTDMKKNDILSNNPGMLMIMWLMSAQYDAEKASYIPFFLQDRLGSCDMKFLSCCSLSEITRAMTEPTKIHRFPQLRAEYLWKMAKFITNKYDGDPSNIWKNASSSEISRRLREITGFGPKLSSMVPINLVRNLGIQFSDYETMDIAVDVHVERVLKRTGLCRPEADYAEMASTAKQIAVQESRFAAELDLPLWATGKFFCHDKKPICEKCYLKSTCRQKF